jgi:hypothetical protein
VTEIEKLEEQIENLSPEDLTKLRAWFFDRDARLWDQQIEVDVKAGKLDRMVAEGLADHKAGKASEL